MDQRIRDIIEEFQIEGNVTEIIPWGNGLINDTFRVNTDSGQDYILQRVNGKVYSNVEGMMRNIYRVTETIRKQKFYLEDGRQKEELYLIPRKDGNYYRQDEDGSGWRVYNFFKHSYSMEVATDPVEIEKAGVLLGQFHYLLRDFPVDQLIMTHPNFHDPAHRYQQLLEAACEDRVGRRHEVEKELSFFEDHIDEYNYFNLRLIMNELPLRVNHNDAKINNIMFDTISKEALCMVDLDTIMPGLLPYDFGDAVRSVMCTGKDTGEDMDIQSVTFDMDIYDHYYRGFIEGCQGMLTEEEIKDLPVAARQIAMENAMRYLTDYLNGDEYFKVKYAKQNLIKTRMHIRLVEDMETKIRCKGE